MEMTALSLKETLELDTALKMGVYMFHGEFTDKKLETMFL
jgi:hypothetical protein